MYSLFDYPPPIDSEKKAIVIGAGIAGLLTAWHLAEKNFKVLVLEQCASPCQQASGNLAGSVLPLLQAQWNGISEFYYHAYQYAVDFYEKYKLFGEQYGALVLAYNEKEKIRQAKIIENYQDKLKNISLLNNYQTSEYSGYPLEYSGLFFHNTGWIHPPTIALLSHHNIQYHYYHKVTSLNYKENQWEIITEANKYQAPSVIFCNGYDVENWDYFKDFPLQIRRGQISYIQIENHLKTLVSYGGYAIPLYNNWLCIGATYAPGLIYPELQEKDHQINFSQFQNIFSLYNPITMLSGRVAYRLTTHDHMPLIGPVPILEAVKKRLTRIKKSYSQDEIEALYYKGLYINSAHGSRGLTAAPWTAYNLANYLAGKKLDFSLSILQTIHPIRFFIRMLKKS